MNRIIMLSTLLCFFVLHHSFGQTRIDVIYLKNGDVLKGEIIENVPNDHVRIELPGGSVFTVKYSDIEKFTRERPVEEQTTTSSVSKKSENLSNNTKKTTKIEKIDQEIAEAQSDKTDGIIKAVVGAGLGIVGWVAFLPKDEYSYDLYYGSSSNSKGNATLFWVCIGVGGVLEIWGIYEWWDAASTLTTLRAKRYDISFQPTIIPNIHGTVTPGIFMRITF